MEDKTQDTIYDIKQKEALEAVPFAWQKGDVILDLYEVQDIIGEGGFGTVYKVYHKDWHTELAVKSPNENTLSEKEYLRRYLKEAEVWIDLGLHPHIVSCYYVRELGGIPRIFMEYIPGGSLKDRISQGIELKDTLDHAIQICRGMAYAHEKKNLIHRDLKPTNCLLTGDRTLKITDFGLAKIEEFTGEVPVATHGKTGRAGTPEYMAPEQWYLASEATPKADIFSFGVVLYEMVMGNKPFKQEEDEPLEAFYARLIESNWSYEELPADLPSELRSLIEKCLKENPKHRPESFASLEEKLAVIYNEVAGETYARVKPDDITLLSTSLNNRGVSLYELGRIEESLAAFAEALKADRSHPEAIYNHAMLLWQMALATDQDVVSRLEELSKNRPRDWQPLYLLGLAHQMRRDAAGMETALKQALLLEPDRPEVKELLKQADVDTEKESWPRCLRTLEGHISRVTSVAISPDGRFALSGSGSLISDLSDSEDNTLRLWDLSTGKCLRILQGHMDTVRSVAISPDGRFALSGSGNIWKGEVKDKDYTLRLWDLSTGQCLRTLEGHTESVTSVAISPDGRFALSGSEDKTLRLWDLGTGQCLRTLQGHMHNVRSVAISPDGHFALSGSGDKTLRLWDLGTGQCLRILEGHTDQVFSVAISPDGLIVLSGGLDNTLRLWDLRTGECLRTLHGHSKGVSSVAISPDGRFALSGSGDDLRLWDLGTGQCLRTLEGHTGSVESVAISPDGHFALSGSYDNTLRLWAIQKIESGRPALTLAQSHSTEEEVNLRSQYQSLRHEIQQLSQHGDWSGAYSTVKRARSLPGYERDSELLELYHEIGRNGIRTGLSGLWQISTLKGHTDGVTSVVVSPDGTFALSGSFDNTLRLWDLCTGQCLLTLEGHIEYVNSVAISPDGRFALSGSGDDLRLWDLGTGQCKRILKGHTEQVNSVAISPDGLFALSGSGSILPRSEDNTLRLWDLGTGQCKRILKGHTESVHSVAISPDGLFALSGSGSLLSGSRDNTLRLWDLSTGQCLRTLKGHTGEVHSVAISPDGRFALSGSQDKTVRFWDLGTGQCLLTLEGHIYYVNSVDISPDGLFALSGSEDYTLRLWDLSTGQCLRTLEEHTHSVTSVAISPDGRFALSGGWDQNLRLWEFDWDYEFPQGNTATRALAVHKHPKKKKALTSPRKPSPTKKQPWWKRTLGQ